jgi:hypothetical protein
MAFYAHHISLQPSFITGMPRIGGQHFAFVHPATPDQFQQQSRVNEAETLTICVTRLNIVTSLVGWVEERNPTFS